MQLDKFIHILFGNTIRYFFIALPFFLVYYVFFRKRVSYRKIQLKFPKSTDYAREISYSALSVVIFSIPPVVMLFSNAIRPHTTFYKEIDKYGIVYFILAFPLMLFMHDTYFYWTHRFMHHPKLFKAVHLIHHKSTNPSPWAAYAFHPLEAFLESMIFVIFLFTIPVSGIHLIWFFVISLVYNVYGHLGFEMYPAGFNKHWLGKWINTSVGHNQHHQFFKGNYGLYFVIWDRLMGTLRPDYDTAFESLKQRKAANTSV